MPVAKITKTFVEQLPQPAKGQVTYFDTELKGFGLRIGPKSKTYIARRDVNGRSVTVSIGPHGLLTVAQARKEAHKALFEMRRGINPNAERRRQASLQLSLGQAIDRFFEVRRKLRSTTMRDYKRARDTAFPDWLSRPLEDITQDMVAARHSRLGANNGQAWANLAMRFLRAVFNFTIKDNPELHLRNPVDVLGARKAWFRNRRRSRLIPSRSLPVWFEKIDAMHNRDARDYLLLGVLTGLRRSELCRLRWDDVNFETQYLLIRETKNHKDHELPLIEFTLRLLQERKNRAPVTSPWVFPGAEPENHIQDPKRWVALGVKTGEIEFSMHDLRRTFATVANELEVPWHTLKRLLNHSLSDVTSGYVSPPLENLRRHLQRVFEAMTKKEEKILIFAGSKTYEDSEAVISNI